jgi:hypothetical protein
MAHTKHGHWLLTQLDANTGDCQEFQIHNSFRPFTFIQIDFLIGHTKIQVGKLELNRDTYEETYASFTFSKQLHLVRVISRNYNCNLSVTIKIVQYVQTR